MIYKLVGTPDVNIVNLTIHGEKYGECIKGQILVDYKNNFKDCPIIELKGANVDVSNFFGHFFIPYVDTESFEKTKSYDFDGKIKELEKTDLTINSNDNKI